LPGEWLLHTGAGNSMTPVRPLTRQGYIPVPTRRAAHYKSYTHNIPLCCLGNRYEGDRVHICRCHLYIMQVASLVPVTNPPLCLHESGTRQLPMQKSGELLPALWHLC